MRFLFKPHQKYIKILQIEIYTTRFHIKYRGKDMRNYRLLFLVQSKKPK